MAKEKVKLDVCKEKECNYAKISLVVSLIVGILAIVAICMMIFGNNDCSEVTMLLDEEGSLVVVEDLDLGDGGNLVGNAGSDGDLMGRLVSLVSLGGKTKTSFKIGRDGQYHATQSSDDDDDSGEGDSDDDGDTADTADTDGVCQGESC